jgi:hypothetical protein
VGKRSAATGHGGSLGGDEPVELVRVADPVDLDTVERPEVVFVGQEVAPGGYRVLSYTSFALSGLDVTTQGSVAAGDLTATVTLTVTNTGTVDGAEVVQVYVQDA